MTKRLAGLCIRHSDSDVGSSEAATTSQLISFIITVAGLVCVCVLVGCCAHMVVHTRLKNIRILVCVAFVSR